MSKLRIEMMAMATLALLAGCCGQQERPQAPVAVEPGYADVNGLHMYYEIHGVGSPLVLLHGSNMSIEGMQPMLARLAVSRQVIAVEAQGHGRTADIDRPFSYEAMADDVALLLDTIGVKQADVFGYSMGGGTALQLAIRHPEKVRKLVSLSAAYRSDGLYPELAAALPSMTPEDFKGSPMEAEYLKLAPRPEDFPMLMNKLIAFFMRVQDWPAEDISGIKAPTLFIIGDSDIIKPEHALDMFKLKGGGVGGDLARLPASQLGVVPGATHDSVMNRPELLLEMILPFLDAPMPEPNPAQS